MALITAQAELPKSVPVVAAQRQPDIAEVEAATASPVKADGDTLSAEHVIYAKKERALRRKHQELRAREDAMKAKEAEYASSYIPKSLLSDRLAKDPMAFLQEHGVTRDQIALMALHQPSPQDALIQQLQSRIDQLEGKHTQQLTKMEEQQKQAYDQAVTQIRMEAKLLVDANPEFETIKETQSAEAIVELIKATFDQEGTLLSVEDAAKEVEAYLFEDALKTAQLRKVKAKLMPEEPPLAQANGIQKLHITEKLHQKTVPMKTLTHAVNTSSKPLSARERAILAFKGQLT